MKTAFSGWVTLNGEEYVVKPDTCYGYADKNWGRDFTSPWVWLSSNNLVSKLTGKRLKNSVFEAGAAPQGFLHFPEPEAAGAVLLVQFNIPGGDCFTSFGGRRGGCIGCRWPLPRPSAPG